jgi:hypothetical protein
MPESIIDAVMEKWVNSGRLQAMSPAQIEEVIHREAAEVRGRAQTSPAWVELLSLVASRPQQGLATYKTTTAKGSSESCYRTQENVPYKKGQGGRGRKVVAGDILWGPGTVRDKAQKARVSIATISRLMNKNKDSGGIPVASAQSDKAIEKEG